MHICNYLSGVATRLLGRKELLDEGFELGLFRRTLISKKQKSTVVRDILVDFPSLLSSSLSW